MRRNRRKREEEEEKEEEKEEEDDDEEEEEEEGPSCEEAAGSLGLRRLWQVVGVSFPGDPATLPWGPRHFEPCPSLAPSLLGGGLDARNCLVL